VSTLGDSFAALKNVMLMQERIDSLRSDVARTSADLKAVAEKLFELDKRVVRIETMIELSQKGGAAQRRIEG
jgi:hypothetical protein